MPELPLLPLILDDVPHTLRQALAQEGIPARDRRPGAAEGKFLLVDRRRRTTRPPGPGQVIIDVDTVRAAEGRHVFSELADWRSAPHVWRIGRFELVEEIARVDKRAVRARVLAALRREVERAGGIWLRVSAFPFPYRSAFNLRIDYDDYEAGDFARLMTAIAGYQRATSHYVTGEPFIEACDALGRLRGLDVGGHGYRHHTYRTAAENVRNIARGLEVLAAAGIEPAGFAAPHGRFNAGLVEALETLGIGHSSEFALAYDELPFTTGAGNLLQIPIHPVCLGLFLDAVKRLPACEQEPASALAVDAAAEHFAAFARAAYRAGDPIFVYGHPTGRLGRYPQVLSRLFATVDRFAAVWKVSLSDWAAWWRVRGHVRLTVTRHGEAFCATTDRRMPYPIGLELLRGRHVAAMPLDGLSVRFSPGALAYETRAPADVPRAVPVAEPAGLRGHVRRWIDWEHVTPLEEIDRGSWRNLAKRSLRRLWSA